MFVGSQKFLVKNRVIDESFPFFFIRFTPLDARYQWKVEGQNLTQNSRKNMIDAIQKNFLLPGLLVFCSKKLAYQLTPAPIPKSPKLTFRSFLISVVEVSCALCCI